MDIGKFLNSGTTYVSTASNGLLKKIGGALVMSLALNAGGAEAGERAGQIKDLAPPSDPLSTFYQSLAAPGSDRIMFVSTRSADFARIVQKMPESLAAQYAGVGGRVDGGDGHFDFDRIKAGVANPFAMPLLGRTWVDELMERGDQGVVFVNAIEAIYEGVETTPSGTAYMRFDYDGGLPAIMLAEDALHFSTVHELYHGATTTRFVSQATSETLEAEVFYRSAVDEALSDLAAVLDYARIEGTFDNGMTVAKSLRYPALAQLDHNSEDMLEYVIAHLSPEHFKGLSTADVMQTVNQIAVELDPMSNTTLKELFVRSAIEKAVLYDQLEEDNVAEKLSVLSAGLDIAPPQIAPHMRAVKTLDGLITSAVRTKELHRELGEYDLQVMTELAEAWGVELPVYQLARIAVFDAKISPPGSTHTSPVLNDNDLKTSRHMMTMLRDHFLQHEQQLGPEKKGQGMSMR